MKICLVPSPPASNKYVDRTAEIIGSIEGVTLVDFPLKRNFMFRRDLRSVWNFSCDILVLNWHENRISNKKGSVSLLGIGKFFLLFAYYRLISKKLIYVRHNIYPHGMKGFGVRISNCLLSLTAKLSDLTVSHSGHLVPSGYRYIPHPLYMPDIAIQEYDSEQSDYYMVFGRVERYKMIHELVKEWGIRDRLIIAGPVKDTAYLEELKGLSDGKNIEFMSSYIDDEVAFRLVAEAKGLLLCHSEDDMVVSGSFFFGATVGVRVFAVRTPFFDWLINEHSYEGICVFNSISELVDSLSLNDRVDDERILFKNRAIELFGEANACGSWANELNNLMQ